jgi:D-alanyl-D-alanine carboxypeptidase
MLASRAVRFVTFAFSALLAGAAAAATPALVVDADSGKVLYAERATDPWFPASITKLMTTYVALDMVRSGRASMDQLITISPEAAAQPPSKMGFKPGMQITLDNALKIIMVKSANDISAAIAENLGGSVEGFAAMMNEASARLGMRESRWVNPHGLPDEGQQTSARDMAILGRALLREFPDNKDLFSISAIKFGRRIMANHNGLLGRYPGVDGMKTGFICSSGFNVVASATRGGRRLITVVMGSPNARERTLKAADLFERGFAFASWGGQTLEDLPASNLIAPPNLRPIICERRGPMPQEDSEAVVAGTTGGNADQANQLPASALAFAGVGASPDWKKQALPPRAPLQPVLVWLGRDPVESAVAATDEIEAKPARRGRGRSKLAAKPEPEAAGATSPDAGTATPKAAPKVAKPKPQPPARPKVAARVAPKPADVPTLAAPASIIDDGKKRSTVNPARTLSGADKPKRAAVASNSGREKPAAKPAAKPVASKKASTPSPTANADKPRPKPERKTEAYAADTKKPAGAQAKAQPKVKAAAKPKKVDD